MLETWLRAEERAMGIDHSTAAAVKGLRGPEGEPIALTVNGSTYAIEIEPRVSLLDAPLAGSADVGHQVVHGLWRGVDVYRFGVAERAYSTDVLSVVGQTFEEGRCPPVEDQNTVGVPRSLSLT
jgi:hypothetical protein